MCYNNTYKSPPMVKMTAGGLEPPRQLPASSCQDYCVCQLHHAVRSENLEGGSLPAETPSKLPNDKGTPKRGRLSRSKTIIDAYKPILGGNYDMS